MTENWLMLLHEHFWYNRLTADLMSFSWNVFPLLENHGNVICYWGKWEHKNCRILPIEDNVRFWEPQKPFGQSVGFYSVAFFSLWVEAKSHFPRIATGLVLALTGLILSPNWPFTKTRPPLVTVAMCNKPCRSNTTHNVLTQLKIHCGAKRKLTGVGYFSYETILIFYVIPTINTILWLFNVSWQITVAPSSRTWTNRLFLFTS